MSTFASQLDRTRTLRWAARLAAVAVLLQMASPAFVSSCQRMAGARAHGCPMCSVGKAAPALPSCHAAAGDPASAAPRAPKPCCLLSAADESGQATARVTLAPPQSTPLPPAPAADEMAARGAAGERCVVPPGAERRQSATEPLQDTILRL